MTAQRSFARRHVTRWQEFEAILGPDMSVLLHSFLLRKRLIGRQKEVRSLPLETLLRDLIAGGTRSILPWLVRASSMTRHHPRDCREQC